MAFVKRVPRNEVPEKERVDDDDHIIQVHSVHPRIMKLHHELYLELMHRKSDWTAVQREMVAVLVSSLNRCHY